MDIFSQRRVFSHKHGGRHKAAFTVDIGALTVALEVVLRVVVERWDLVVPGVIPARGGSSVVMLPVLFTVVIFIIMISIQVLQQAKGEHVIPRESQLVLAGENQSCSCRAGL